MRNAHIAPRVPWRALGPVLSALALVVGLTGIAEAADTPTAQPAGQATQAASEQATLQARQQEIDAGGTTVVNKDGSVEWFADPAILAKQRATTLGNGYPKCGSVCDGKDPNSYYVTYYGGGGYIGHYLCASDAVTIYRYHPSPYAGDPGVEHRWSTKCETSWARGCCYTRYMLRGYWSSTGGERSRTYGGSCCSSTNEWTAMLDNSTPKVAEACYDNQTGGPADWRCGPRW
jgi:hypothetical protein